MFLKLKICELLVIDSCRRFLLRTDKFNCVCIWNQFRYKRDGEPEKMGWLAVSHCHGRHRVQLRLGDILRLYQVASPQQRGPPPALRGCDYFVQLVASDPNNDITVFSIMTPFPPDAPNTASVIPTPKDVILLGMSFMKNQFTDNQFVCRSGSVVSLTTVCLFNDFFVTMSKNISEEQNNYSICQ